jgi:hypothetical protein
MGTMFEDAYGHRTPVAGNAGAALTAGAVSTTAVGTIAPTTSAGASPTVTSPSANDQAGSFTLSPVTGGGAQAAGEVAVVTFAVPYASVPRHIAVSVTDNAGGSGSVIAASATSITVAGFKLNVGAALTTAHTYAVSYHVIP